jgi:hypothetical protein
MQFRTMQVPSLIAIFRSLGRFPIETVQVQSFVKCSVFYHEGLLCPRSTLKVKDHPL